MSVTFLFEVLVRHCLLFCLVTMYNSVRLIDQLRSITHSIIGVDINNID